MLISKNYALLIGAIKPTTYIMTIPCFQIYWQHPTVLCLIICFAFISTLFSLILQAAYVTAGNPFKMQTSPASGKKLGQPHLFMFTLQELQNCLTWLYHAPFTKQSLWPRLHGVFLHERTWLSYLPTKAHANILSVTLINPYWIYFPLVHPNHSWDIF